MNQARFEVEKEFFDRAKTKKIICVLDAKSPTDLPELLFQKGHTTTDKTKTTSVEANNGHIQFFRDSLVGFTKDYANRSVLQLTGLTMPGVTVMNLEDSDTDSSDVEDSAPAGDGTRKRRAPTRQLSARGAITRSKARKSDNAGEESTVSPAITYCKNKLDSLEINDTVWENEFCDMTSLIASKHYIPYDEQEDIADDTLDRIKAGPGQLYYFDFADKSEESLKLSNIFDDSRLKKRCSDLDKAFTLLSENDFEAFQSLQSCASKPTDPKLQSTFYEASYVEPKDPKHCFSYVEGRTPRYCFQGVTAIRNIGQFLAFDVLDKLIQFVADPTKETKFSGKSKETKALTGVKVNASKMEPTVHFCTFEELHAAIQAQPDVLQKFMSVNYDTILWFGSGANLCKPPSTQSPSGTYNETIDRTQRDSVYSWVTRKLLLERTMTCSPPMESLMFFHDRYAAICSFTAFGDLNIDSTVCRSFHKGITLCLVWRK